MKDADQEEVSLEELIAAANADLRMEKEGYEGWLRLQRAAMAWLVSRPGGRCEYAPESF